MKNHKVLCTYTKDGSYYYMLWDEDERRLKKYSHDRYPLDMVDSLFNNTLYYTYSQLEYMNIRYTEWINGGEDLEPENCDACKYRFICWTEE